MSTGQRSWTGNTRIAQEVPGTDAWLLTQETQIQSLQLVACKWLRGLSQVKGKAEKYKGVQSFAPDQF